MERKVLFTASTFSHILNFHLPYLAAFRERDLAVHVACGGEEREISDAERVVPLPLQKRMGSVENFKAAGILRRLIKNEDYALICTHTSLAAFFTRLAVRGMKHRPPLVNIVHGYLFDDETLAAKRAALLAAERLAAPQTDLLLAMNRYDCEVARRYRLGSRVEYIPGVGVDFSRLEETPPEAGAALRRECGIPEDAFVLLYAAEFSPRKSQETLIRAVAALPERAVLVLAGDGSLWEPCRQLAAELGLGGRVRFPGHVSPIAPWYRMADAAVSASRSEGLPFNVMEAMYAGLPVVASRVKGHTDLIEDGKNGLLYHYGDAAACAVRIRELLESEALRRRLGAQARADAAQYGLDRVFPQVWARYEEVLKSDAVLHESALRV